MSGWWDSNQKMGRGRRNEGKVNFFINTVESQEILSTIDGSKNKDLSILFNLNR